MPFAEKINRYNRSLQYRGELPEGISIMNPFENKEILQVTARFYDKFYNDELERKLILGINPGRLGAGATGIPFTDTKRLSSACGIGIESFSTHEPSSVFVYDMINAYGGVNKFYSEFFINSIFPLAFIRLNDKGNWINCNYYDLPELAKAVRPFMVSHLQKLLKMGIDAHTCFVLGKKNAKYIGDINNEKRFFQQIVVLEHPRYIEQYRSKQRETYISGYINKLSGGNPDE